MRVDASAVIVKKYIIGMEEMSELGARKFTYDTIPAKRVKSNDDSDASSADTPNEGQEEKERMQRMTQAIRTIIDVS